MVQANNTTSAQYDALSRKISLHRICRARTEHNNIQRTRRNTHSHAYLQHSPTKDCCTVFFKHGVVIPVIFVLLMGAIIVIFLIEDNGVCETPIGYCASISCVCGNVLWQGYVFMFVTLSLGPVLLMIGVMHGTQPRLCCKSGSRDGKGLSFFPFLIVWTYLISCTSWSLTGIMPWILPGNGITPILATFSQGVHQIGVQIGSLLPVVSAILLGGLRARDSCRQGGAKSGCHVLCRNLCQMERAACGCFGYTVVIPFILCLAVFGMHFTSAHGSRLKTVFDICVGNTDEVRVRALPLTELVEPVTAP